MKTPVNPRISGLLADFRRLQQDFVAALGIYPGAHAGPLHLKAQSEAITRALEFVPECDSGPLIVVRGSTGTGKTTLLNAMTGKPQGDISWKRPTDLDSTSRLRPGFGEIPAVATLAEATRALGEPADGVPGSFVDTPDTDFVEAKAANLARAWTEIADLVIWVSSPQRFRDDLRRWLGAGGDIADHPAIFILGHADECAEGEIDAIMGALAVELGRAGFDNPVAHALPRDSDKLLAWLASELNAESIGKIRVGRLARLAGRFANELDSWVESQVRLELAPAQEGWRVEIRIEADHLAEMVMEGLDERRHEMEAFLEADLHDRLRGIMAFWLKYVARIRSGNGLLVGGWRAIMGQIARGNREPSARRDQASRLALEPAIDSIRADKRRDDLDVRLRSILVTQGVSLGVAEGIFAPRGPVPWNVQLLGHARAVLAEFEAKRLSSGGVRGLVRETVIGMANYSPPLFLVAIFSWPVILFFDPMGWKRTPQWFDLFLPAAFFVIVLIGLQALLGLVMPFQWVAIRAELKQRLRESKATGMEREYLGLLDSGAARLAQASNAMRNLLGRTRELARASMMISRESPVAARVFRKWDGP